MNSQFESSGWPTTIIQSKIPLYAAMAASPEYIIYYENKVLCVIQHNDEQSVRRFVEWANKTEHVIDLCHYQAEKFLILTRQKCYLFNAKTEDLRTVNSLVNDPDYSTYHRCTSNGKCLMLGFSGRGTIVEQRSLTERTQLWKPSISCGKNEFICCLRLLTDILGLTIVHPKKGSRFEVRNCQTMSVSHTIPLPCHCYQFTPMNKQYWYLVPYYQGKQQVLRIDTNKGTIENISTPLSPRTAEYEAYNNRQMVWNVAVSLGNSSHLLIRRETTICYYDIN